MKYPVAVTAIICGTILMAVAILTVTILIATDPQRGWRETPPPPPPPIVHDSPEISLLPQEQPYNEYEEQTLRALICKLGNREYCD